MISIISRFTTSLVGLLGEPVAEFDVEKRMEVIRLAMLASMDEGLAAGESESRLWHQVRYAANVQELWHLRSDLMVLLSQRCGERLARQRMAIVSESFRGVVPPHQMPQSGRFN